MTLACLQDGDIAAVADQNSLLGLGLIPARFTVNFPSVTLPASP